jgi:hypothetical protein
VPPAGGEPAEEGAFRRFLVEVKRLRIILRGERLDLLGVDQARLALEALTDVQVLEKKPVDRGQALAFRAGRTGFADFAGFALTVFATFFATVLALAGRVGFLVGF